MNSLAGGEATRGECDRFRDICRLVVRKAILNPELPGLMEHLAREERNGDDPTQGILDTIKIIELVNLELKVLFKPLIASNLPSQPCGPGAGCQETAVGKSPRQTAASSSSTPRFVAAGPAGHSIAMQPAIAMPLSVGPNSDVYPKDANGYHTLS